MTNLSKKNIRQSWHVFKMMLVSDAQQAKALLLGKIIDRFIWVTSFIIVASYLLPAFGVASSFGKFMLGGLLASVGMMEAYHNIVLLVSDIQGDFVLSYYLTLPVPATLVFLRLLVYNGLFLFVQGVVIFPLANLFLPEPFSYASIHWGKFFLVFLTSNFFYSAIVLWSASFIQDMRMLGKVWARLLHPLWLLGGFQFCWSAVHAYSPKWSYLAACNPVLHATEGLRVAMLGQNGFLPFWNSVIALVCFTFALTTHAIMRFKKRLDIF